MAAEPAVYVKRLQDAKLRVTAARLMLLQALEGTDQHLDAETIVAALRARLGSVSAQAVYDNLHVLTGAGLLRRIALPGGPAHYETRVGDNHHHVVCRSCGATADVDCAVGSAPCLEPSSARGFLIDEAEVTYWGLCPECQSSAGGTPALGDTPAPGIPDASAPVRDT